MTEFNQEFDPTADDDFEVSDADLEASEAEPVVVNDDTVSEEPEAPKELIFQDEFHRLTHEKLVESIAELNALVARSNAANGDRAELRETITETSTDPDIIAAREARDAALDALYELVTPLVEKTVNDGAENQQQVEAKIKEMDQTVTPGISFYKKLYGEKSAEHLPKKKRLTGARLLNSATGGRRIRGFNVVVTVNGEVSEYDAFSKAAKAMDVETSVLQDLFFDAAGKPEKVKDAPDKVRFSATITETDEDGQSTEVEADIYAYRVDTESD